MTRASFQIPQPEKNDSDEVVLALETARAHAEREDAKQAIHWIRRAAEAAGAAGRDARAVALARAAADLAGKAEAQPATLAPHPGDAPDVFDIDNEFADTTIVDRAPSLLQNAATPTKLSPPRRRAPSEPQLSKAAPEPPRPPPERRSRPEAAKRSVQVVPRQAVRVAVPAGPGRSQDLSVRMLAEGESVPSGMREALLVAVDPSLKF